MPMEDIVQLFDTWELVDLLRDDRVTPPDGFWTQRFATPFFSEKKTIVFEELPILDRRMAPFVMPHLQGRVMRDVAGPGLRSFEPAYLKPKHVVDPSMTIQRQRGEPLGGNLSRQERFNRITAQRLQSQAAMIKRRWEWMAAQAAIYGYVDVAGEDYTPVRVNFNRAAGNTVVLTGTAQWDDVDADPLTDIAEAREQAFTLGRSPINEMIFGLNAWKLFRVRPEVKELMNIQYRLPGNASFNISPLMQTGEPVQEVGTYQLPDGGTMRFFVYSNSMVDPVDGVSKALLHTNDVVGLGPAMNGIRAFGAIEDLRAGLQATDMFPKQWEVEDPSVAYVMTQSAPLMVPANPDNTFRIRVA